MRSLLILSLIVFCSISLRAQNVDSIKKVISGVYDSIEVHDGDSTIYVARIELSNKHFIDGLNKANAKDYQGAISEFDRAVSLNNMNHEIYFNRGLAYFFMNIHKMAVNDFTRSIEIDPKYYLAYLQRGVANYQLNEFEKAVNDFNKAIEIYPKKPAAYLNLATTYMSLKKMEEACKSLEKAKDLGDSNAILLYKEYCE